jgi:hypothetical protein
MAHALEKSLRTKGPRLKNNTDVDSHQPGYQLFARAQGGISEMSQSTRERAVYSTGVLKWSCWMFENKRIAGVTHRRENVLSQLLVSASTHIGNGVRLHAQCASSITSDFVSRHLVRLFNSFWLFL